MRLVPTFLAAIPVLALAILPAQAAAPLKLDYKIYAGGLEAISATISYDMQPQRYQLDIDAKTAGSIGQIFPWVTHLRSNGRVAGGQIQPEQHVVESTWKEQKRSTTLRYDGAGGFLAKQVVPPPSEDNVDEVAPALTAHTVDLLSAVAGALRRIEDTGTCTGTQSVYDGRRRFEVKFADGGSAVLEPSSYTAYAGPTRKCEIRVEPGPGFWRKNQKRWFTQKDGSLPPITVWAAPIGSERHQVPVKIESVSPFGAVVVQLVQVRAP
jgi:Protein of unknown function (DUF3108)